MPRHVSNLRTLRLIPYLVAFLAVLIVMVVANYNSYVRMQRATCDDCFIQFGFPFWVWEEGGYVGITRVLWAGVVADLSLAIWAVIIVGWVSSKLLRGFVRHNNDAA